VKAPKKTQRQRTEN